MSDSRMVGVAVIGCGYWGPNLVRNFSVCADTRVVAVCDKDVGRLKRVARGGSSNGAGSGLA